MSGIPPGAPGFRRYGKWAGEPEGKRENLECCVIQVRGSGMRGMIGRQCARKRGSGPGGEFCVQHAKWTQNLVRNLRKIEREKSK